MNIGIDIGGSHIGVGLVGSSGKIINKKEVDITAKDKKNIEKMITNTVINFIKSILKEQDIEETELGYIGIASPGTIENNNSQTYKMDKLLSFFEEFNHSLKQFELMFYLVSYNNEKGVVLIFDNSPFFIIKNHVLFLTNEIFHKLTFEKCYYHLVD